MSNIKKRHIEFDIAKGISIIGMVFVHVFEEYMPELEGFSNSLVNVIQTLVGAPCFMFCMGAGIVFSSHSDYKSLIKRGISIFITAYVLNLLRGGISFAIINFNKLPFNEYIDGFLYDFLQVDILSFAGLSLILMGIFKKIDFNEKKIIIASIILSIIGSFVRMINVGPILNYFVGLFVGTINPVYPEYIPSYFSLFNWFIFVAFGYSFGKRVKETENKKKLYAKLSPTFALIVACYLVYAIPNNIGMINPDLYYFYHLTTFDAAISIMSVIAVLGLYYLMSFLLPSCILSLFSSLSRNINRIYCLQWIIIGNLTEILYEALDKRSLPNNVCYLLAVGVLVISYLLAILFEKGKIKHEN